MFIPLGHKSKDNGLAQVSQLAPTDANQRIDFMFYELDKQGKRLALIESKLMNPTLKEELTVGNANYNWISAQGSYSYGWEPHEIKN